MTAGTVGATPTAGGVADFDVLGPLPTGTVVLEASAGTGKTFTIAALAARYVAEGVAGLDQLMLVTFGRMASTELRSRVHDRLVGVEAAMATRSADPDFVPDDPIEAWLVEVDADELDRRHDRVAQALADFDAATIATTHEFCLRMLDGLGVLGDRETDAVYVEEITELTREVATDLYLHRYADRPVPPFAVDEAVGLAGRAVSAVHAVLVPRPSSQDRSSSAERAAYCAAVRAEVERRKRTGRLLTYDDMLTRLRDVLADPRHGAQAAHQLRERYPIVLIDEFQDTDPIQWEIIDRAFRGHVTLIMIGDPKQAIYAFRGADIYSYLEAVDAAEQVSTLGVNRRSDQALVSALDVLWSGTTLGEEQIVVRPVQAAAERRRLTRRDSGVAVPPVRLRYLPHATGQERGRRVDALRRDIGADLVADVIDTLSSGLQLELDGRPPRPVAPADIAVLVRTNRSGEALRDALVAAGLPAVMHGASSVFASPMAKDWHTLLTALERPRSGSVREAALTCFFGWTIERLALADDDAILPLSQTVRDWSRLLAERGVAALLEAATVEQQVPERLLALVDGARQLTDLRHLGQSLHATMVAGQLGIGALAEWLAEQIATTGQSSSTDVSRRLETDAAAVTLLTVHRSKGLQFPIVYLPEAWDQPMSDRDDGRVLNLHETDGTPTGLCSVIDVGGSAGLGRAERFARHRAEVSGENLRLAYVATTRAQCQVVAWWAASHNTPASALQRFICRAVGDPIAPAYAVTSGDPTYARPLGPGIVLEEVGQREPARWQQSVGAARPLVARHFDRSLDLAWRRTSYSALTAAAHGMTRHEPGVSSEPVMAKEDDELGLSLGGPVAQASGDPELLRPSPMADLPMGADFGSIVHEVYEEFDTTATDPGAELLAVCTRVLAHSPGGDLTAEVLANALLPSVLTPLGPLALDARLSDIRPVDRLAEVGFEFPLAGGDRPVGHVRLGQLAPLLRRHLTPGDPLVDYAGLVEHVDLADQVLRGYLNGSIDAVVRIRPGSGAPPRYLVVDYKTNWLGAFDGVPLRLIDYRPAVMAEAMMTAHYPLQALLYSVALHRMLRWRQPGYDPATHLGGVLYLFVRGMAGPDTPRVDGVPCGVFSWQPPAALIVELSDLLAGGDR